MARTAPSTQLAAPKTTPDLDALIASAVATALASTLPGIVEAVVARLTPVAPVAAPVAPIAPVAPVAAVTTTKTTTVTTTTTRNQSWKATAFLGALQDRLTPTGKAELVVRIKPGATWYYPQAYTTVRQAILALDLQVGDQIALDGFTSLYTPTKGPNAGKPETKYIIRRCRVLSRKADRSPAVDLTDEDVELDLDEGDSVASATPASPDQQQVLSQLPADESPF